jgi:protein required for attachment to host cells
MSALKVQRGNWVVVCDGRKSIILENIGDEVFPYLRTIDVQEHSESPTRDMGTAPPGRVHPSVGTARSSVEQTDWHDESERSFLHAVATHLDEAVKSGRTKALIIVAPPRALGMLRNAYTSSVREALRAEVDKDLVKVPIDQIEKRLFS